MISRRRLEFRWIAAGPPFKNELCVWILYTLTLEFPFEPVSFNHIWRTISQAANQYRIIEVLPQSNFKIR